MHEFLLKLYLYLNSLRKGHSFQVMSLDMISDRQTLTFLSTDLANLCPLGLISTVNETLCTFFLAGVLFSIENAKFWPNMAILSLIYALFGVFLQA